MSHPTKLPHAPEELTLLTRTLHAHLTAVLGAPPKSFAFSCDPKNGWAWGDPGTLRDLDPASAARAALLGATLPAPDDRTLAQIEEWCRTLSKNTDLMPEVDEWYQEQGCALDLEVVATKRAAKAQLKLSGYILQRDENYTESRDAELSPELLAALRSAGVAGFSCTFSGGGDSGSRDEVSFSGKDPSRELSVPDGLCSEVGDFLDQASEKIGLDWYNNDGGGGSASWSDGDKAALLEFYANIQQEAEATYQKKIPLADPQPKSEDVEQAKTSLDEVKGLQAPDRAPGSRSP